MSGESAASRASFWAKQGGSDADDRAFWNARKNSSPPPVSDILRDQGDEKRGGPVAITYEPTPSSNPADPRTAAMGYDKATKTLRIEWGDGGVAYNYYDVEPAEWKNIRRVKSPGKFINRQLNSHQYGPAD